MTPETLTLIRKAEKQSLSAFALRLGISRNTLALYEKGKQPIPAYIAMAASYIAQLPKPKPEPIYILPIWKDAEYRAQQYFIGRWRRMQDMLGHYPADIKMAEKYAIDDYNAVREATATLIHRRMEAME